MTATAQPRTRRIEGVVPEGPVLGLTLLSIGAVILAGFAVPDLQRYQLLIISAILLAAFALTREYAFAIPAGLTGGLGTMILLTTSGTLDPASVAAVPFLSLSGGFLVIWLLGLVALPRSTHPWPLVPATVLGLMGAGIVARQPMTIDWIQAGIATVLVIAGAAILLRRANR
jgi:hypothetical protein